MRESTIEKYLVERVKALGGEVRKVTWQGRKGAPDRLVMLPSTYVLTYAEHCGTPVPGVAVEIPRTIWIELKATGEKVKPHQAREHERMRSMGQRVEVIDSMEGVDEVLR